MISRLSLFEHVFYDHGKDVTVVLYHGTGGDEYDLLPLVGSLGKRLNVLSLRGNVVEQGMNRFFVRSFGVFDQESIRLETDKLVKFLEAWEKKYTHSLTKCVHVGYSNGANMILATLLRYPHLFSAVGLLHPMLPYEPGEVDLAKLKVLVTAGLEDRMIPASASDRVEHELRRAGAHVEVYVHQGEHEIQSSEIERLIDFVNLVIQSHASEK